MTNTHGSTHVTPSSNTEAGIIGAQLSSKHHWFGVFKMKGETDYENQI